MSARKAVVMTAVALCALVWLALKASADRPTFPHETHDGLFPSCMACHEGIPTQEASRLYTVMPADCVACHDGATIDKVSWTSPSTRSRNLNFDHALHVTDQEMECSDCHQETGSDSRMAVARPAPETCFNCHEAGSHMVDGDCATCHNALTEVKSLSPETIAGYPRPEDHAGAGFLFQHGDLARTASDRCAVCHAKETCSSCHLNASSVEAIQKLGSDDRVLQQASRIKARWPKPADHESGMWMKLHGKAAGVSINECANCHVQSSCTGCHGDLPPRGIRSLPVAQPGGPSGVALSGSRPPGHDADFYRHHGVSATLNAGSCMTCHETNTCQNCHGGQTKPGFHPPNYMFGHRAEAFARDLDCANCHSTEVFCRSCHENSGASSRDSRSSSYHDANPLWLISHGQAARQSLDNCASCHQQTDCQQCHSAKTGWRINPHGPDFDAQRIGNRSLLQCSRCHFSDPR